jgi:hypothetical protein
MLKKGNAVSLSSAGVMRLENRGLRTCLGLRWLRCHICVSGSSFVAEDPESRAPRSDGGVSVSSCQGYLFSVSMVIHLACYKALL